MNTRILPYFLIFSTPLYIIRFTLIGIPTNLFEVFLVLSFVVTVFDLLRSRDKSLIHLSKDIVPVVIFAFWTFFAGLSVFISGDIVSSLGILKSYFIAVLLFSFVYLYHLKKYSDVYGALKSYFYSAATISAAGIVHYYLFRNYPDRIDFWFLSPNYLSMFIAPVIPMGIYLSIYSNSVKRYIYIFLTSLVSVVLLLTFSRGAWIAVLLSLLVFVLYLFFNMYHKKSTIARFRIVLTSVIVLLIFLFSSIYYYPRIFSNRFMQSDSIRLLIWETSLGFALDHPLVGVGLGNFQNYFKEETNEVINYPEYVTPHAVTPHNIFLNIWLQTGLFGLVSFLLLIVYSFRCLFVKIALKRYEYLPVAFSLLVIILQGLFDSTVWKNDLMILFALFFISAAYQED